MASPFVANIKAAEQAVWPAVSAWVHKARARGDHNSTARLSCRETIWALAREGRLRTPADDRLHRAVRAYFEEYEIDADEPLEVEIYDALQAAESFRSLDRPEAE